MSTCSLRGLRGRTQPYRWRMKRDVLQCEVGLAVTAPRAITAAARGSAALTKVLEGPHVCLAVSCTFLAVSLVFSFLCLSCSFLCLSEGNAVCAHLAKQFVAEMLHASKKIAEHLRCAGGGTRHQNRWARPG